MTGISQPLNIPETMPEDFAQYLRERATDSEIVTSITNSRLDDVPAELWRIVDQATRGLDHRKWAFADLWGIIVSASGLLPTKTLTSKWKAQDKAAKAIHAAKLACDRDDYAATADLKDLLALSAASQPEDGEHVAAVARLLFKIGQGNSGIKLPQLLEGLTKALRKSADVLQASSDDPLLQFTGDRLQAEFPPGTARRFERGMAEAQGFRPSISVTTPSDAPAKLQIGAIPSGVCLQLHTRSTSLSPLGVEYTPVLYGPFEPVHDSDLPRSPAKPQQNHFWTAVGLIRWLRTYTGDPHKPLVRKTVDALLGNRSVEVDHQDYVKSADDKVKRMN